MFHAKTLKHGPKIDGGSLADMVHVCGKPALRGVPADIAEMDKKAPLRIDL